MGLAQSRIVVVGQKAGCTSHARPAAGIAVTDRVVALCLLAACAPVIAAAACVVALLSRRPPFVAHTRVGFRGRSFRMLKVRTMWPVPGAIGDGGLVENVGEYAPDLKDSSDPRVTSRFARFCRRYSIDELPQLVHVLAGDMSLVGPRPITRAEIERYYSGDVGALTSMKPGITGLWQVRGRNRLSYRQRRRLDLFLVRHFSWRLYLRILGATLPRVLFGKDAW